MDNDLERSVRLLEDALSPHGKSLFKPFTAKTSHKESFIDLSTSLPPPDVRNLLLQKSGNSFYNRSINEILDERNVTGSVIQAVQPWKTTVENLYMGFFEVLQTHISEQDILEVISDMARLCSDSLKVIDGLKSKVQVKKVDEEIWLQNECNTWRLIYILYQDRLSTVNEDIPQYFGSSEKLCVQSLFKRDSLIRESQLVIDWLEHIATENDDEELHFADKTCGWENTLHQLQSPTTIVFKSSRPIVTRLDPDATNYQKKPLHDLDMENEKHLVKCIFREVRCGKLKEAQRLCIDSGHIWRAALYEGWRLYHDPFLERDTIMQNLENKPIDVIAVTEDIEGNAQRDIWKNAAWKFCEKESLDIYDRAVVATFCGCLKTLLPVCKNWEDTLWAHMKVLVDIRVETEIRDCINRSYLPLPEEYWEQRVSLNEVFSSLETSSNPVAKKESQQRDYIIQKLLILDEVPTLIETLVNWAKDIDLPAQFLRFAAHLVLFLEFIGLTNNRPSVEQVLEHYINRLAEMSQTQLVAYYVSKMCMEKQILIYASYLERIVDGEERKEALYYAEESDLNTRLITIQIVENIRNLPQKLDDFGDLHHKITETDKFKISALDWMLFYEDQKIDALKQANAMIFVFIAVNKIDAAQLAFNKIPSDTIQSILSEGEVTSEINQVIKEHLSYKTYLDAHEAFNNWFKQHNSKPVPPESIPESAQFTEKVAHQHRMSQYKAETERWKLTTSHLAKTAKSLFYNVLLFPEGGWLCGAKDAEFLRSKCIPEVVMLLYAVLFESGLYEECIELADIIAAEKYELYKVYSKVQLEEILLKFCETSVALLNAKKDPWGSDVSV